MSVSYQEGFKNAAGDTWTCVPSAAAKVGNKYVYSGSLTPEQVNSPDFNIAIAATGGLVNIADAKVRIIYTVPLTSSTQVGRVATNFASVAYGAGNNVVICGGNGLIQRSTDSGATWSSVDSGTAANLRRVRWGGAQFVVVGDAGTILTSSDGAAWAQQSSGVTSSIMGIARAGISGMVIVGAQDMDRVSPNGVDWR